MSDSSPGRGSDQFNLRFPDGMRDEIRDAAVNSGRSMNAEIVQRLKLTFEPDDEDTLTIRLSDDARNALSIDSAVHGVTDEERVAQVIEAHYDPSSENVATLRNVDKLAMESAQLYSMVSQLQQKEDADFLMLYGKAVQMYNVLTLVMNEKEKLDSNTVDICEKSFELIKTELKVLKKRHDDAEFRRVMDKKFNEKIEATDREIRENSVQNNDNDDDPIALFDEKPPRS